VGSLRLVINTVMEAFGALGFILLLLLLVAYIFAIFAMSLFSAYSESDNPNLQYSDKFRYNTLWLGLWATQWLLLILLL